MIIINRNGQIICQRSEVHTLNANLLCTCQAASHQQDKVTVLSRQWIGKRRGFASVPVSTSQSTVAGLLLLCLLQNRDGRLGLSQSRRRVHLRIQTAHEHILHLGNLPLCCLFVSLHHLHGSCKGRQNQKRSSRAREKAGVQLWSDFKFWAG